MKEELTKALESIMGIIFIATIVAAVVSLL